MKISRRLLLLFAGSVILPGLTLAYLSFRSVKDERLLLEKSLEAHNQDFADALAQLLRKTRQAHWDRLREQLRQGGSAETPGQAWALAARLLDNPVAQSVAVFHGDTSVFPRALEMQSDLPVGNISLAKYPLAAEVRQEWRQRHYGACLRALRALLHGPDSLSANGAAEASRFGFRLLELKCLTRLGENAEAIALTRTYIRDLEATDAFDSYHPVGFYLSEAISLATSLETLPREMREELFSLHQRLPLFLSNADFVRREWPATPEDILRNQSPFPGDSLKVQYHEGVPYLRIGFPWLTRDTQVLIRLNEGLFTEAVRAEIMPEKRPSEGGWKDIDFAILNRRDEIVLASDSLVGREPALERPLDEEFPAWRVIVFKKPASELQSLGRQRIALQYTLLGFSLLALTLGMLALFRGLDKEQHMVQMKANFLSAVSHELKTPLTSIRMFAEMLASGRQTQEEKRKQYVQRIGHEAERLQAMIEGILNYTRLEEDPRALRFTEFDFSEAAGEMAALLSDAFAKAGIRLITRLAPAARLRADYDAVRSVMQNLLENSLKYSRPGTEVVLEVRAEAKQVVLRVADQGIGIPASDLKHIFEKFFRAGDEMTRKTRGSGLGLTLVKRIVDAHKGHIKVNSAVNEGTEMIVTFNQNGG